MTHLARWHVIAAGADVISDAGTGCALTGFPGCAAAAAIAKPSAFCAASLVAGKSAGEKEGNSVGAASTALRKSQARVFSRNKAIYVVLTSHLDRHRRFLIDPVTHIARQAAGVS